MTDDEHDLHAFLWFCAAATFADNQRGKIPTAIDHRMRDYKHGTASAAKALETALAAGLVHRPGGNTGPWHLTEKGCAFLDAQVSQEN